MSTAPAAPRGPSIRPPRPIVATAEEIVATVNARARAAGVPVSLDVNEAIRRMLEAGARAEYARTMGKPCPHLPELPELPDVPAAATARRPPRPRKPAGPPAPPPGPLPLAPHGRKAQA